MMRNRCVALVVVCAVAWATPGLAQPPGAELARTPWGDPDLQGHWNNNTIVPMERPPNLAGRDTLTDEEVAERSQTFSALIFAERPGDTGFYNEFWFEYGQDTNRTSLVIDRPDGKLPALTPEAAARQRAAGPSLFYFYSPPESHEDLSFTDRCLARGMNTWRG